MSYYETLAEWEDDLLKHQWSGRNRFSPLRCEICSLPPLYRVNSSGGYVVVHWPGRGEYIELSFAEALAIPPPIGVQIYTCGSDVCIFRAEHHGVPAATP